MYQGESPSNHHFGEDFLLFPSILSKSKFLDAQLYWELGFLRGLGVLGNYCMLEESCCPSGQIIAKLFLRIRTLGFGHFDHFASKNDGRYRVKVRVFSQSTYVFTHEITLRFCPYLAFTCDRSTDLNLAPSCRQDSYIPKCHAILGFKDPDWRIYEEMSMTVGSDWKVGRLQYKCLKNQDTPHNWTVNSHAFSFRQLLRKPSWYFYAHGLQISIERKIHSTSMSLQYQNAMSNRDLPDVDPWTRNIRDTSQSAELWGPAPMKCRHVGKFFSFGGTQKGGDKVGPYEL